MKNAILVADSGGTKTDWCLIDSVGNKTFFSTESYHPHGMTDQWIAAKRIFWDDYTTVYALKVVFYGSGCTSSANQQRVKHAFKSWGIDHVEVGSDLVGAAVSVLKGADGFVGILGTGSVIAQIENAKITQLFGGFGYLIGDEGGGYNFGRLLVHDFLSGKFSESTHLLCQQRLGGRDRILNEVYSPMGKKYLGELSRILSDVQNVEINEIHERNIDQFIGNYLPKNVQGQKIYFVGSYAAFNRDILRKKLEMSGWVLGEVVARPIEELAEYFSKSTF